jgi:hypothetical protein
MIQKIYLLLTLTLLFSFTRAQTIHPCGTDEWRAQLAEANPQMKQIEEQANKVIAASKADGSYAKASNGIIYIPVVFHIIHDDSLQNIPQWQIMDQIRVLNEDFRRSLGTPGFSSDPVSSDMKIEFRLAQYDPNGKKSDGIIRIKSALTNNANDAVKALSYWDSDKYLNVWVVKTISIGIPTSQGIVLGYAQFPWDRTSKPTTDGIVIRSDQIGVIGTGQISQGGRTLTHEIGHWLGLYHTFQDGCSGASGSNCASQGDRVCDTPPVESSSSGCSIGKNSCNNDVPDLPDMIRNYMDYSDGTCMNTYTAGQKTRIYSCLASFRNTIYGGGTNNIAYAGIDPATGNYKTVTASATKAPYMMDFESNPFTAEGAWKMNNFNNPSNGWQVNNSLSISGTSSMYMRNYSNATALLNSRDGFQSPEIDITGVGVPYVEFYYAYAQRSSVNTDSIILFISNNFGMLETRLFASRGGLMTTAPEMTNEFLPNQTQWKKVSVNISAFKGTNTRFRFEFVNRRGNNVFIDKFSITNGATGIGEEAKKAIHFSANPNPMTDQTVLHFTLTESSPVTISLTDITGRVVKEINSEILHSGDHEIVLSGNNLTAGLYFIDFKSPTATFTHKLLVN